MESKESGGFGEGLVVSERLQLLVYCLLVLVGDATWWQPNMPVSLHHIWPWNSGCTEQEVAQSGHESMPMLCPILA